MKRLKGNAILSIILFLSALTCLGNIGHENTKNMKNSTKRIIAFLITGTATTYCFSQAIEQEKGLRPNILLIYADDLGYSYISAYNKESKIITPNMDQLMPEGISFMDAHSPVGICAPSRYSLLTGRYAWKGPPEAQSLGMLIPNVRLNPGKVLELKERLAKIMQRDHRVIGN